MTLYEEGRRVVARGITFINNKVLLIERYKKENNVMLHYYTIPGGGVDVLEKYHEAAIREMMEETTCHVEIVDFLEKEYYPNGICYWYYCKYLSGTPKLSGEEKERNSNDNSYQVVLIDMNDIDKINILGKGKDLVKKCYERYLKDN